MRLEKLLNWKQCSTLIVVSTNYAIIADGTTLAQMVDFDPMVESECHKQQKYRQARIASARPTVAAAGVQAGEPAANGRVL